MVTCHAPVLMLNGARLAAAITINSTTTNAILLCICVPCLLKIIVSAPPHATSRGCRGAAGRSDTSYRTPCPKCHIVACNINLHRGLAIWMGVLCDAAESPFRRTRTPDSVPVMMTSIDMSQARKVHPGNSGESMSSDRGIRAIVTATPDCVRRETLQALDGAR